MKIFRFVLTLTILILNFSGCHEFKHHEPYIEYTKDGTDFNTTEGRCIDNFYYEMNGGDYIPKFNQDGTAIKCNKIEWIQP